MDTPKILSTKNILHTRLFDVTELELELPNKKHVIWNQVERLPTVDIFAITEKYELCMINEYRPMFGKTILSVPAGFMDKKGETPLQTAQRELQEEAGISANQWEILNKVSLGNSGINAQAHLFLAKDLTFGEQALEEDEQIEMLKVPLHKAVEKVMTGEISGIATMLGILLLEKLHKEKKL